LPQIRELSIDFVGVDPIDNPIPIQPTVHYSMGGIPTDVNGQVIGDSEGTPIVGFYASGECACVSVHGANRLGTNSLLEASLFGRRAGNAIAEFVKGGATLEPLSVDQAAKSSRRILELLDKDGNESVEGIAQELKTAMTNNCGIYRDSERLAMAQKKIEELKERFTKARIMDKSSRNRALADF
jgi:succinate dehydrogenase / fumarate reductase flavoprotein subunit